MTTATSSFLAGTILLLAIFTASVGGLGASALVSMAGGESWSGVAGTAAFFVTMIVTLIIDDRRAVRH